MRPAFLDEMSWEMAEVYGAVTDRILINIARHFPYIHLGGEPLDLFNYQVRKLAEMGQVNSETIAIITKSLEGADEALQGCLEAAIVDALKTVEPSLRKAAEQGLLYGPGVIPPTVAPNQMQAFKSFYAQSADKMNLVNTVMLESTQAAYQSCLSDIVNRMQRAQSILNAGAGEVVTGVSTWNEVITSAVGKMVENGLTGYVDHGGHHWTPEAYVAMDVRTTVFNTARAAVWERCEEYGSDIYQVSTHNGARPKCYPWQAKLISRTDNSRDVPDLDGEMVHVYAQSETSYGAADGLFGVNCKHYPTPFIPGFSALRGASQSAEENAKAYEESQQQRALERKLRKEKRDLEVLKAQGAPEDALKAQQAKIRQASKDIDAFCDETGRARRRNREFTPINAKWPDKETYSPAEFPTEQRDRINAFFGGDSLNQTNATSTGETKRTANETVVMGKTPERRTYGKTTGMQYSATLGDEITLQESGRKKNTDGEWVDFENTTKTITVPANTSDKKPMVYQLRSGAETFMAHDETSNTIMQNGRIAVNYDTGNNNTRARVREMLENEIDVLGGIREDGVWYRVTSNAKDVDYIRNGTIRPSINHATGEKEDGLSVWERPKYYDKYMERLTGDVIGIGADGEPLLDVKTVKLLDSVNIEESRKEGRLKFLKTYNWTEEQLDAALKGAYSITR